MQCKGGVGADSMSSLTIAAEERRSLLVVGSENSRHFRVMQRGAQQGLGVGAFRWMVGCKAKLQ